MESERFDALTRRMGNATDRRAALKGLLGLGAATIGVARLSSGANAARRGYSGPRWPEPEPCAGDCGESESCDCSPNHTCIGGLCFLSCTDACGCETCTFIPGKGSFCIVELYGTPSLCEGICKSGYACNGGHLCLKPCEV